ncbi:hypothetical protein [Clostridium sp. N3C]|uniref:hypothetical protein n=1 Tax=Clostridium sp. N3C TaxID=1776758 RepID=UPI0009449A88|nr:hypothetical protein [Clostridium sp. N3C]
MSSRVSIFSILAMTNLIQILMDFMKGAIIFIVIALVSNMAPQVSFIQFLKIFIFIFITTIIMYIIGGVIGSFALVYKRISSLSNVLYYVVLFFSGIFYGVKAISVLFPFSTLNKIIISILSGNHIPMDSVAILGLQFVIYLNLMFVTFKINLRRLYQEGKIFHV